MEHLSAYADGELSGTDKRQMEAHLISCTNCSELLNLYRKMSEAEDVSNVPVPDALLSGVMERVHNDGSRYEKNSNRHNRTQRTLMRYAPIAACLLIVLLAIPFAVPHLMAADDAAPAAELAAAAPEYALENNRRAAGAGMPVAEEAAEAEADFFMDAEPVAPAPAGDFIYDMEFEEIMIDAYSAEEGLTTGMAEQIAPDIEFDDDAILEDIILRTNLFAEIFIAGELPNIILNNYIPLPDEYLFYDYTAFLISHETAELLILEMNGSDGFSYTPIYENGSYALVFHTP